mmetsp:Transcript_35736/g.100495  ORF Transcript_35736/g.100495 Transcript_35736/m.100495 type:complete len:438 (+) Transcript_35736:327-1640(+)
MWVLLPSIRSLATSRSARARSSREACASTLCAAFCLHEARLWSSLSAVSVRTSSPDWPLSSSSKRSLAVQRMSHWPFSVSFHFTISEMFLVILSSRLQNSAFCCSFSKARSLWTCSMLTSALSSRHAWSFRDEDMSSCCACMCSRSLTCSVHVLRCCSSLSAAARPPPWSCRAWSTSWSRASSSEVRSRSAAKLPRSCAFCCSTLPASVLQAALALSASAFACWQVFCISPWRSFRLLQTAPCLFNLVSSCSPIRCSVSTSPCSRPPTRCAFSRSALSSSSTEDERVLSVSLVLPTAALVISWLPSSLAFSLFKDICSDCTFSSRSLVCDAPSLRVDSCCSCWLSLWSCPSVVSCNADRSPRISSICAFRSWTWPANGCRMLIMCSRTKSWTMSSPPPLALPALGDKLQFIGLTRPSPASPIISMAARAHASRSILR